MKIIYIVYFIIIINTACFSSSEKKNEKKQAPREDARFLFGGDIMLDWGIGEVIEKEGYKYPFVMIKDFLDKYDYRFCNLECPVSEKGKPHVDKKYIFLGKPEFLRSLKYAGINGVSLANNHTNDFGKTALIETMANLYKNGIGFTGAGMNIGSAHLPVSTKIRGMKFAIFAYTVIACDDSFATDSRPGVAGASLDLIKGDIGQFRPFNDFIIVSIHWGVEYSDYPIDDQIDMAHSIIDSGADAIIGHHPHIFQGIEIYKGKPIFYSLGNFVFGSINEDIQDNILVELIFLKKELLSFSVYPINGNKNSDRIFQINLLKGDKAGQVIKHLINISRQMGSGFSDGAVVEDSHLRYYFKHDNGASVK